MYFSLPLVLVTIRTRRKGEPLYCFATTYQRLMLRWLLPCFCSPHSSLRPFTDRPTDRHIAGHSDFGYPVFLPLLTRFHGSPQGMRVIFWKILWGRSGFWCHAFFFPDVPSYRSVPTPHTEPEGRCLGACAIALLKLFLAPHISMCHSASKPHQKNEPTERMQSIPHATAQMPTALNHADTYFGSVWCDSRNSKFPALNP